MERYGRGQEGSQSDPVSEWRGSGPETGLEEGFWTMRLGEDELGYPERPDEPDCIYYLRTGFCGYGSRCRFNHPRDRTAVLGAVRAGGGEFPERMGQPLCQYYMRTGTCKFGASCKYHHPKQGSDSVAPVTLNYYGYPLRPGEKECTYYVKTGQCKFGPTCKFHHPQLTGTQIPAQSVTAHIATVPAPVPAPALYQTMQSPSGPSSQPYGVVVARPPLLPGSYSPYGPVLLPPGAVPFPSWSPYAASVSPLASPGTQSAVGSGSMYGITQQSASAPVFAGSYQPIPPSLGPSSSEQKEPSFPDRPGQPECQYYMKTGECKYGSSCRYHHPPDLVAPRASVVLSPIGLPLRPGFPVCHHYTQRGQCKFGPACKFDHPMSPMRELSYSPSASSLADMPVAPYPVGYSVGTLAPSSSSSELLLEHISGVSKDSSSTRMSSSLSSSSGGGSVGSILSKSGAFQSGVQQSGQASGSPASGGNGSGSTDVQTSS